ncbi:MAG: hypothetical protein ABI137_12015 [Antricoccus sp.]
MSALLQLFWRRNRSWMLAWILIVGLLSAAGPPTYAATYLTDQDRAAATSAAQHNAATTVLYGRLGSPGTPGQMFSWELGTFLTLIAAVMAVLLAVSLTRRLDEDSTFELGRGSGLSSRTLAVAAVAFLCATGFVVGLACTLATGLYTGKINGVDWAGAGVLGLVVALTFTVTGMLTALIAQLVPTSRAAASTGGALVAVGVVIRAVADSGPILWLRWLSPMALRSVADPFMLDRVMALAPALIETVALACVAVAVAQHHDLNASLLHSASHRSSRLHVHTTYGLVWRLIKARLYWTTALVAMGGMGFAYLGSATIDNARTGRIGGGLLGAQITGTDPGTKYFVYSGTVLALVLSAVTVTLVTQTIRDENSGLAEHIRSTGTRPSALLKAYLLVTLASSILILTLTGLATALVATSVIPGDQVFGAALHGVVDQWPALALVIACAAVVTAAIPRAAWLAWLPLAIGGTLTMLGGVFRVPDRIIDLSMFGHTTSGVAPTTGAAPQLILLCLTAAGIMLALARIGHRDLA